MLNRALVRIRLPSAYPLASSIRLMSTNVNNDKLKKLENEKELKVDKLEELEEIKNYKLSYLPLTAVCSISNLLSSGMFYSYVEYGELNNLLSATFSIMSLGSLGASLFCGLLFLDDLSEIKIKNIEINKIKSEIELLNKSIKDPLNPDLIEELESKFEETIKKTDNIEK